MENQSNYVDKMKPLQMLYNLDKAGFDIQQMQNSSFRKPLEETTLEFAERIFEENKELFGNKEEFIKYVVYGE